MIGVQATGGSTEPSIYFANVQFLKLGFVCAAPTA